VVGGGQPEEEREHGGFGAEGDEEEDGERRHQSLVLERRQHAGEVGHVEGAGGAVEEGDGHQEEGGGHEVERHVPDAASSCAFPPPSARRPKDEIACLEPDVEVEDVAGEEGAGDAEEEPLVERVVEGPLARSVSPARP
jgi:hypothetical protein